MAGTRLSGLMSGMDTESIISQLMEARKTKVTKVKKQQMKANVKQDAWKELNTKLKNLQSKYISNMRFSNAYAKKVTKVSNSSAASVITGESAVNGVQELKIDKLAKTAYLTGGEVTTTGGGKANALTKLSELGFEGESSIQIKAGSKAVDLTITGNTTISDVLNELKKAGLNANFDEKNQRFFISAKNSGEANDFSITAKNGGGDEVLSALGLAIDKHNDPSDPQYDASKAHKVDGQDAEIFLNGAKFKSSTNVFEINGLTITAQEVTDGTVTLNTETDTDGIYDMIKNFLKEYNEVINEMDKLYNAASAKGYEPLTSEEKEAMTDSDIEEWEKKVKDSILRRDENLNDISSTLKAAMSTGININGKTMYLSDFGIGTLGYFNSSDNEKNSYHIDGDPDDASTSGNEDKLKRLISTDPNTVISFFTKLSQNLYEKMSEKSRSIDGYRSFGNFYDDKKMKSDYDAYTSRISEMEKKLNDYEDKWYKKFAKMESALAKLQSKTSAFSGLFGGN